MDSSPASNSTQLNELGIRRNSIQNFSNSGRRRALLLELRVLDAPMERVHAIYRSEEEADAEIDRHEQHARHDGHLGDLIWGTYDSAGEVVFQATYLRTLFFLRFVQTSIGFLLTDAASVKRKVLNFGFLTPTYPRTTTQGSNKQPRSRARRP